MDTEQLKRDLAAITGQRAIEAGETMTQILARLDAIAKTSHTPEKLQHYLSKRSYVKAIAWLEDPSTPHHQ